MVEPLVDLRTRNIRTKPELEMRGAYQLGDKVFEFLRKLVWEGRIKGAYFTHYYFPRQVEPHVKVAIRYGTVETLNAASSLLDVLCEEQREVVIDKGRFDAASGEWKHLPTEIAVDYIICHSFEWLLKAKERFGTRSPLPSEMAGFFLQNRKEIETKVMVAEDIFRDAAKARPLKPEEAGWVWERLVHHLLNAFEYPYDKEPNVKALLYQNGIMIQPMPT